MSKELPEGITFSREAIAQEEVVPVDYHLMWDCSKCGLAFDAFILAPNSRYEGLIRNRKTLAEIWSNKLPRDRNKAIKFLRENLERKVENHKKGH